MADQFNDSIPALANQIANDIPDIQETLGFLKDVFQNFVIGWSDTVATGIFPAYLKRTALTDADDAYTMLSTDIIMECDCSGGTLEIDLVTAASIAGRFILVKVTDATNALTLDGNGAETIDGSATMVLDTTNEAVMLYSDGTNYKILFHYDPATINNLIVGDGTAGRVLRSIQLKIEEGADAAKVKFTMTSRWNGDTDSQDDVPKNGSNGDYAISVNGDELTIAAAAFTSGTLIGILACYPSRHESVGVTSVHGSISSGDLVMVFRNNVGVAYDIAAFVGAGDWMYVDVLYLTDA